MGYRLGPHRWMIVRGFRGIDLAASLALAHWGVSHRVKSYVSHGLVSSVAGARACAYMPRGGTSDSTTTDSAASESTTAARSRSRSPSTEDGGGASSGVHGGGRIRESRARCHAARDAYVAACERAGPASGSGSGASAACVTLRAAYDAACPRSWVEHFDAKRAEDAKVRRVLASREGGA